MRSIISTAPDPIRAELRDLNVYRLLERAAAYRPGSAATSLAHQADAADCWPAGPWRSRPRSPRSTPSSNRSSPTPHPSSSPGLGIGTESASALLVAAGDNPERLRNEATFAHLCGVAPIDASSGKHERHRLNRGGDRQANSALWHIVITRMVYDPRTRDYIDRRTNEGLTKKEAFRCLKRYIAREVYNHLPRQHLALDSP